MGTACFSTSLVYNYRSAFLSTQKTTCTVFAVTTQHHAYKPKWEETLGKGVFSGKGNTAMDYELELYYTLCIFACVFEFLIKAYFCLMKFLRPKGVYYSFYCRIFVTRFAVRVSHNKLNVNCFCSGNVIT